MIPEPVSRTNGVSVPRILVVEDTAVVAQEFVRVLERAGYRVVGPCASVGHALAAVRTEDHLCGALLDINLAGVSVFPVAHELRKRGVPFIFLTGYARETLPATFERELVLEKPFGSDALNLAMIAAFGVRTAH